MVGIMNVAVGDALMASAVSVLALLFSGLLALGILRKEKGNAKMQEISKAIQEGAMAFLHREYKTVAVIALVLAVVLYFAISAQMALTFIAGAFASALAGYIGMSVSTRANVRVTAAAKEGLQSALSLSFRGGAVTGMAVAGLALLGVSGSYYYFNGDLTPIIGFGFGACLISLFARIGGGIYTKAADVGADLIGKVEKGIPEDDPRNPAVIADNVGDNVGDCAGMGADLFETYAITAIGAMLLGKVFGGAETYVLYPLLLGAVALIASMIGLFFVRTKKNIMNGLYKGFFASAILSAAGFYYLTSLLGLDMGLFYTTLIGIAVSIALFRITDYYTSREHSPVQSIAIASQSGSGVNVITGLAVGMESTMLPALVIIAGILGSYHFAQLYGIAIAAMAMVSLTAIIVAMDSYGPITDNAGGIAEMSGLSESVRKVTDELDAVGNTTKAVTKSFAIGSAALAALTLFAAYVQESEVARAAAGIGGALTFALNDPSVLVGLFIGGAIPFLFSSWCMRAVGRAAFEIVGEVRRQFREIRGIMQGKAKPDYAKCVDIVTVAAIKELKMPALLAVASPLVVGMLLGTKAVGGMLMGSIITGFMLALQLSTGGAAWDNAKKYIEKGNLGGKGSDAHKAAVVGDTVGDPCKDTAGPAINPLIKVMNTVALIFAALFI